MPQSGAHSLQPMTAAMTQYIQVHVVDVQRKTQEQMATACDLHSRLESMMLQTQKANTLLWHSTCCSSHTTRRNNTTDGNMCPDVKAQNHGCTPRQKMRKVTAGTIAGS